MKLSFFDKILGSFFFTGYLPGPTGTYASMLAFLFYFYLPFFENLYAILSIILFFSIYGFFLGDKFEAFYNKKDPEVFTLDEAVGSWISLIGAPKTYGYLFIAFIIWRLADIIKPFPARNLEKLSGGKGIMLDDIISSFYVCILMNFLNFIFKFN